MTGSRTRHVTAPALALAAALASVSCAAPEKAAPPAAEGEVEIRGIVAAIDTQPWTYDGHAVVQVDVPGRGRVNVQLPARWNLCEAAPVDVQALAIGSRVHVVGAAEAADVLTVCSAATHRLEAVGDGAGGRGGGGSATGTP